MTPDLLILILAAVAMVSVIVAVIMLYQTQKSINNEKESFSRLTPSSFKKVYEKKRNWKDKAQSLVLRLSGRNKALTDEQRREFDALARENRINLTKTFRDEYL